MVVVLSRSANVEFCPSKMFRTPVTPHETNLLLSEITVWHYSIPKCGKFVSDFWTNQRKVNFFFALLYYREPLPNVSKRIRRRIGGSLKLPDLIPGLKISFPRGSCPEDITASVKVLYDYEPWDPTTATSRGSHGREAEAGLASPILMLGPHGYQFDTRKKPVEIEVPIPHYREILELFPRAR